MAPIHVITVGMLRTYVNEQESFMLEGWAGRSVHELLEHLGIPSPLVGVVLVNGNLVQKGYALQDGDQVKLIPLLGGG